jgi:uncharacterized protein YcbK (DUF882 family)
MVKPVKVCVVVVMLGWMVGIKGSPAESARRTVKVPPAVSTEKTSSTDKASVSLAAVVAPEIAGASAGLDSTLAAPVGEEYRLRMYHLHTGESIDVVYRMGDIYLPEAMDKLNHFLRDHRTQDVSSYDPKEFDLLYRLLAKLGKSNSEIDVVCGYRTPWSNHFLRTRAAVTGVAQHSQHMLGKAIDIRVPGVATAKLRDAALALRGGGVGYYPLSQFVHVDVGPVRRWSFAGVGE